MLDNIVYAGAVGHTVMLNGDCEYIDIGPVFRSIFIGKPVDPVAA